MKNYWTISRKFEQKMNRLQKSKKETFKKRLQNYLIKFKTDSPQITEKYKYFLAGFIEGEGSFYVGLKKNSTSKYGLKVDPAFSVTQNKTGIVHLIAFMVLFQTGRIDFKSGSKNTYVFKIENRQSLVEKVIPFYKSYVLPWTCSTKKHIFNSWVNVINKLNQGVHKTSDGLAYEILPLIFSQKTKGKRKKSLQDYQKIVLFQ